jgi:membrane-bound PQQ-dependent dehydrogenase (glucose/quinate/shikimate family)
MAQLARHTHPLLLLPITLFALGLVFLLGGGQLALLGGSWYYFLAGLSLVIIAILVWLRRPAAIYGYAMVLAFTILWAIYESGFDIWALAPRITAPAILSLWFLLPGVRRKLGPNPTVITVILTLFSITLLVLLGSYSANRFQPENHSKQVSLDYSQEATSDSSWAHYGGDQGGQRFVNSAQINKENVSQLELTWSYRISSGDNRSAESETTSPVESTPIEVDGRLFFCTSTNVVISLDSTSGEEIWRYDPSVTLDPATHKVCRGVAYHENEAISGTCKSRLLMGTVDNRLIAISAKTGKLCTEFGDSGIVNLDTGLGEVLPGYNYLTSPPTILNGIAVVGSFVLDNQSTNEPPGVVRGYDVVTGKPVWAWDVLNPNALPPGKSDQQYPRSTPNVWSVASADAELGLVFLPTGNPPPDFFGGHRSAEQDRYNSSIVALDIRSGNVRWSFQTVNHDVWDLDIASQPVAVSWPAQGGNLPALIVTTKRGEIFIVDRRTGEPITAIEQRPVPQNPVAGEWLAPTQPYSVGFPSFAPADLDETSMWGATPLDQMWCRIRFRRSRYEGQFTPQSTTGSIAYPGAFGVINWGSVSLDPERQLMVVNTSHMPWYQRLIVRSEADKLGIAPWGMPSPHGTAVHSGREIYYAQGGTPYAIDSGPFLSPLGFPCNEPPWGELAAVDLITREIVWRRPLGTTRDVAPLGLPLPTGIFNIGGSVTTSGGVTFIAATIDNYLRAFDIDSGEELWKTRLPAGGQATPISYVSQETGKQYVVITAGGHGPMMTKPGDYVLAYALPDDSKGIAIKR